MAYREHTLKVLPQYYEAWKSGVKCFELRKDDRDYRVGDFVKLCEWDGKEFTGRSFSMMQIDYILRDCPEYGLMDGYCILGFARPPIEPKSGRWIPCSERLPEELQEVNITWVNREPEPYYDSIKDVPFTGSGVYCKGKWYWYSAVCVDYLREYGFSPNDNIDGAIEVTAWMPLPEPYKVEKWEEPEINPCRGCDDYDGRGGCKSNGGCGAKMQSTTRQLFLKDESTGRYCIECLYKDTCYGASQDNIACEHFVPIVKEIKDGKI